MKTMCLALKDSSLRCRLILVLNSAHVPFITCHPLVMVFNLKNDDKIYELQFLFGFIFMTGNSSRLRCIVSLMADSVSTSSTRSAHRHGSSITDPWRSMRAKQSAEDIYLRSNMTQPGKHVHTRQRGAAFPFLMASTWAGIWGKICSQQRKSIGKPSHKNEMRCPWKTQTKRGHFAPATFTQN